MKLGIFISIAIVIAFVLILVAANSGAPDAPTADTAPDKLTAVALPADLPVAIPANDRDATTAYRQAFAAVDEIDRLLKRGSAKDLKVQAALEHLADKMIDAASAGAVDEGFLERNMPLKPMARPENEKAIMSLGPLLLPHAVELYQQGNPARALLIAKAAFVFGHRAFAANRQLLPRFYGLALMQMALQLLADDPDQLQGGKDTLQAWTTALREAHNLWEPKVRKILSLDANIGDLLRLARQDQDESFRIAAILRLGMQQHNARTGPNRSAIQDLLADLAQSGNPDESAAAKAAQAYSRDEYRTLGTPGK
jgi:hypothetical protein